MKFYHYFVSYQYNDVNKEHGFGQTNLLLKKQLVEADTIDEMRKYLENQFKYSGVVILNFILLKEEVV